MTHVVSRLPTRAWLACAPQIQGKVRDLSALLAVDEPRAALVLRSNPNLAMQDAQLWQTNFDTLASQLGLAVPQVREAVLAKPQLLSRPPRRLLARCAQLARLAASHGAWRAALDGAAAAAAAVPLLTCDARALQRLAYLAAAGLQARHPGMLVAGGGEAQGGEEDEGAGRGSESALLWDAAAFEARHPQFRPWLARVRGLQRQAQALQQAAAAEAAARGDEFEEGEEEEEEQEGETAAMPWQGGGRAVGGNRDEALLEFMLGLLQPAPAEAAVASSGVPLAAAAATASTASQRADGKAQRWRSRSRSPAAGASS